MTTENGCKFLDSIFAQKGEPTVFAYVVLRFEFVVELNQPILLQDVIIRKDKINLLYLLLGNDEEGIPADFLDAVVLHCIARSCWQSREFAQNSD